MSDNHRAQAKRDAAAAARSAALAIAQHAFKKWLLELDGALTRSEDSFDAYTDALIKGETERAKGSLYLATHELRVARTMIKNGLDVGV